MITLEGLRKDILRLQTLVIHLQDLVVSHGERISELEEDIRPEPQPPYTPCSKCSGTGWKVPPKTRPTPEGGLSFDVDNAICCKACSGCGLSLTPSSSSPKTSMDKGVKGNKNNQ